MTMGGKLYQAEEKQVPRPEGRRIMLEGCEQDGEVEGPDVRPRGPWSGVWKFSECGKDSLGRLQAAS